MTAGTIAGVPLRPTFVEVDLDAITENVEAIRAHVGAGVEIMPVIKADAYGHGLVPVARHLEDIGVGTVGVAYVEEGVALREAGLSIRVHVLGGAVREQIPAFLEFDLDLTVPSLDKLTEVAAAAADRGMIARVHLKIDTGMERIGVHHYHAAPFLLAAAAEPRVEVVSVFSHLANSDEPDLSHAREQLDRFLAAVAVYDERGLERPLLHIANSAAVEDMPETHLDLVRPGLLVYGVRASPGVGPIVTRPALAWRSRVIYFKVVEAGAPVGYGSTWAPEHQTRVITLPVGYGDGYRRSGSNSAEVIVRGVRHPVVGRICMDQTMVDIGWGTAYNGDEVILVGVDDTGCSISIEELAAWNDTVPYEVLTGITARVPRVHLGGIDGG